MLLVSNPLNSTENNDRLAQFYKYEYSAAAIVMEAAESSSWI